MNLESFFAENHDDKAQELIKKAPNLSIPWFLMASYGYYILDKSMFSDEYYDSLAKSIHENWDTLTHRHKKYLDKEALKAGTAYYLKEQDYPTIVKSAAQSLLQELNK